MIDHEAAVRDNRLLELLDPKLVPPYVAVTWHAYIPFHCDARLIVLIGYCHDRRAAIT
jgi:hypothetical protein